MRGEFYSTKRLAAGETAKIGAAMAGFLCEVAGSLTITDFGGNVILNAYPVVEGFNRIPVIFTYNAGNLVTSDTAVGALLT